VATVFFSCRCTGKRVTLAHRPPKIEVTLLWRATSFLGSLVAAVGGARLGGGGGLFCAQAGGFPNWIRWALVSERAGASGAGRFGREERAWRWWRGWGGGVLDRPSLYSRWGVWAGCGRDLFAGYLGQGLGANCGWWRFFAAEAVIGLVIVLSQGLQKAASGTLMRTIAAGAGDECSVERDLSCPE